MRHTLAPWRGRRRPLPDSGITLVELAVAILIMSIGAIGALRAADQSRIAIGGTEDRLLAQIAARNRAEELRLYSPQERGTLPDSVRIGGQLITLRTTTKTTTAGMTEATVSATAVRGGGALIVTYLPLEPRR